VQVIAWRTVSEVTYNLSSRTLNLTYSLTFVPLCGAVDMWHFLSVYAFVWSSILVFAVVIDGFFPNIIYKRCALSMGRPKFPPHSSHIFQPTFLKLRNNEDNLDTTLHAKFGWVGWREGGLHRERFLAYFWFFPFSRIDMKWLGFRLKRSKFKATAWPYVTSRSMQCPVWFLQSFVGNSFF